MRKFLLTSLLIALGSVPAKADLFNQVEPFCNRKTKASIQKVQKDRAPDGFSDIPTHVLDQDFRTASGSVPWSKATLYEDPVTGHYAAVSDRNYSNSNAIFTLWTRDVIRAGGVAVFSAYQSVRYEFDTMMIPSGDHYLVLRGCDGRFPVNEHVAEALRTMPKGKKIFVKLYAEDWGDPVINEIGPGTVEAWKKVYANWSRPIPPRVDELGF